MTGKRGAATENVDAHIARAGKKGHRYVKKSFERRKNRIRRKWLEKTGKVLEKFEKYLETQLGCEHGDIQGQARRNR